MCFITPAEFFSNVLLWLRYNDTLESRSGGTARSAWRTAALNRDNRVYTDSGCLRRFEAASTTASLIPYYPCWTRQGLGAVAWRGMAGGAVLRLKPAGGKKVSPLVIKLTVVRYDGASPQGLMRTVGDRKQKPPHNQTGESSMFRGQTRYGKLRL